MRNVFLDVAGRLIVLAALFVAAFFWLSAITL
jgi:hypothetical protein